MQRNISHSALRFACRVALCSTLAAGIAGYLFAQTKSPQGKVERIKVHGKGLEGNLSGDSPDRDVSIYLPPSYGVERNRRYPVLYMLHGFTDDDARWFGLERHWINLAAVIDKALAGGGTREMIVVMPNAYTRYQGSMYSNSITTGNWEDFVSSELVSFVDGHYRTIPETAARGLAGHSMGGYGAMRIGMKHPEVFSSVYLLSPCCMAPNFAPPGAARGAAAVRSMEDFARADFLTKATFASAAAWSPNPGNPPFFFDFPSKDGQPQPLVSAKWAANAPLAMIDQYIANIKRLKAIAFDAGTQDAQIAGTVKDLDRVLTAYGIPHTSEVYDGNHVNRVAERIETKALPFFTKNLAFQPARKAQRK